MPRPAIAAAIVCLGIVASPISVVAQGMGLEGLHDHRREGSKVCMADHFHDGSGIGKSRKQAEAEAVRAWAEFTAWEYGLHWASYRNAGSKSMNCTDTGGSWSCQTSARACRPGR
jgi:hypothetical protein